jgi:lysyl-tRNA synthetase class 2
MNLNQDSTHQEWTPSCELIMLNARAMMNSAIRRFFDERGVLEVETPVLVQRSVTDPGLSPFQTEFRLPGVPEPVPLYLQTSPEFAMKRLLAGGAGSIYQIAKAFRNEERGRYHNPEFTLLEWYRPAFSLADLLAEVEALIGSLALRFGLALQSPQRFSYAERFESVLGCHPLEASVGVFREVANQRGLPEASDLCGEDRSLWLPGLGQGCLTSIYDYPAILPSLAQISPTDARFVERAEVFWNGTELGNGFHELLSPVEQRARFEADLARRKNLEMAVPGMDERLLACLESGLPPCAGIALGLDRLLMILVGAESIEQVLSFAIDRA